MAYRSSSSSSRGCGSCGGSAYHPTVPTATAYDPCAGGLTYSATRREASCTCGGRTRAVTKTYDSKQCPTFAISCETKLALRECAKVALCDLLTCVSEVLCPDGKFDATRFERKKTPVIEGADSVDPAMIEVPLQTQLLNCLGQAVCTFMHCVPEALCPEPCQGAPEPVECLPCGYAVEVLR